MKYRSGRSRTNADSFSLHYAGAGLDRAADYRRNRDWLEQAMTDSASRLIPVWRERNLVTTFGAEVVSAMRQTVELRAHCCELVFLGIEQRSPVFAADLSHLNQNDAEALAEGEFMDLRRVGPVLKRADAALLAYARGMLFWHRTHRHCGRCGAVTENRHGGHLRACTSPECGGRAFPRTDPAIIVLVEHGEAANPACLLGRSARFPPGVHSTLAGFVEPGESLEEAVTREVFEESGIEVGRVEYLASQPWPFPSSLMIGFHAHARTTTITRHDGELENAAWFSPEELRNAGEWGDRDHALCLPRRDSIARFLIERWLERVHPAGQPESLPPRA